MKQKTLLLWDRMGDYHRARWSELANIIGYDNCFAGDLGAGDQLYKWSNTQENSQYFRLSDKPVEQVGAIEALNAFKKMVRKHNIKQVCIPGYGRTAYIFILLWCRFNNIKVLMFAESWYASHVITDYLKGILVRFTANTCLVSGKFAASHFNKRLNYPTSKIIEGYSTVDNKHFASSSKDKLEPKQLLCVARFAEVKNLKLLIKAFVASEISKHWQLRIVGGGPLKEEMVQLSQGHPIKLDDWLGYKELPDMYKAASCFILPSSFEPWGLVVNEAMAAGLPIIVSDQVGAYPDLLIEGKNGWLFKYDNQEELVELLNKLSEISSIQLEKFGKQSEKIVAHYSSVEWAKKVAQAFKPIN